MADSKDNKLNIFMMHRILMYFLCERHFDDIVLFNKENFKKLTQKII